MKVFNFRITEDDGERIQGTVSQNKKCFLVFIMRTDKHPKCGEYLCKRDREGKYIGFWELQNVQGMTEVIIHNGNLLKHSAGCILVAEKFGELGGELAILESTTIPNEGLNEFMNRTKDEKEIKIIIEKPENNVWVA